MHKVFFTLIFCCITCFAQQVDWQVPYLRQRAYGDYGESACGPTSLAMILLFQHPGSGIQPVEIYHAGTQAYSYHGPAIGYYNVGFADGDTGLDRVPTEYHNLYIGTNSGMRSYTEFSQYLSQIWNIQTSIVERPTAEALKQHLRNGPVLGHVYALGSLGHYLVIRGYDEGNNSRSSEDDTYYVNDPYDNWRNIRVNERRGMTYQELFVDWRLSERDIVILTPQDSLESRRNTVVVDDSHCGEFHGNNSVHSFQVSNPNATLSNRELVWKKYYGSKGSWVYPIQAGHSARWTPRLVPGEYRVYACFVGDAGSGTVQYDIHSSDGSILRSAQIDQRRSSSTWCQSVLVDSISLTQGCYVRVANVPVNTNMNSIRFQYIRTIQDDHSNDFNGATTIVAGTTYSARIDFANDLDFFRIDLSQESDFVIQSSGSLDTFGYLYDNSRRLLASDDDSAGNLNFKISKRLPVGSYFIAVKHYAHGTGAYSFRANVTPVALQDDHGNTRATATSIVLGRAYNGRIGTPGDWDYFKFTSTQSCQIAIESNGSTDTFGYLFDASGNQLACDDDSGPDYNFRILKNISSGTFFIAVKHYGQGLGDYSLVSTSSPIPSSTQDDHGNSITSATSINPGNYPGRIEIANDIDYFRINVSRTSTVTVYTSGSTDSYGSLLNSNGGIIAQNDDYGSDINFRITRALSSGVYYIAVRHYSTRGTGQYSLTFQVR